MMKKMWLLIGVCWMAGWFLQACEEEDCALTTVAYGSFMFVDEAGKQVALADTLSVTAPLYTSDTLYVYEGAYDTLTSLYPIDTLTADKGYHLVLQVTREEELILNRKTGATGLEVPFSYTATTDTFFLRYSAQVRDTLWVTHENLPYFTSMDCGTVMHYKLTDVKSTHHLIDSLEIVNKDVTNNLKTNVKIYFSVAR